MHTSPRTTTQSQALAHPAVNRAGPALVVRAACSTSPSTRALHVCPAHKVFVLRRPRSRTSRQRSPRTSTAYGRVFSNVRSSRTARLRTDCLTRSRTRSLPQTSSNPRSSLWDSASNKDAPGFLFNPAYHKRIPADGVGFYTEGIWEQVQTNKVLDLPTQMRLSTVALAELTEQTKSQRRPVEAGRFVDGLGAMMRAWRTEALTRYDRDNSRYHAGVYQRKHTNLLAALDAARKVPFTALALATPPTPILRSAPSPFGVSR
ncbi:root hair defective 3 GTP-binding protein-domain-containing protein [Mycena belliarum]|uniref:Root hair defective 3 GTP-binding protein-domain-containing protein n=1 Tax=Mycena belliarum TaxID=1033014 RepID=A0AAD6XYK6_9AGAR|nr:root hair defective 3 GTP-binding protein-domain-containing protein [Mycena belliae]